MRRSGTIPRRWWPAVVIAVVAAIAPGCGDDGESTSDSTPPDVPGAMRLTIDGETTAHDALCRDQPTAVDVVNYYGVPRDEPVIVVSVAFTTADHDTIRPGSVFASIEDVDSFAYVDGLTLVDISNGGLTGKVRGSGLLYEDSTEEPADVSITWSCESPE